MQFAEVDGERRQAEKGLKGICPCCSTQVIPRCGNERIHHWAHKKENNCTSWYEPETEWHRSWKECYPEDWREVIHFDAETGEKHIADVKTKNKLVIEFQHSRIQPAERESREDFYYNMIWVVDGFNLKDGLKLFNKGKRSISEVHKPDKKLPLFLTKYPQLFLPEEWLGCSVPVYFDYSNHEDDGLIVCLMPISDKKPVSNNIRTIFEISRKELVYLTYLKNNKLFEFPEFPVKDYSMLDDSFRTNLKKRKKIGYCIRTKKEIPFDLKMPLSSEAFEIWSKWKNENYREKYCHFSGEESSGRTSFRRPVLPANWDKVIKDLHD